MTKKLFAIVLAAMLAVTMFTFPAFADTGIVTNIADDNTISFSWGVVSGATKYQIVIKNSSGTVLNSQTVTVNSDTNSEANCKATYRATNGGKITIEIDARDAGGFRVGAYSTVIDVPVKMTGTNGVSVTSSGNTTTVSWNAAQNVKNYYVLWVSDKNVTSGGYTSSTSLTISSPIANIKSVTVYVANDTATGYSNTVGSWSNSGSSSTQNPSYQASGITVTNVYNGYAYISWNRDAYDSYYIVSYSDAYGRWQSSNSITSTSASVPVNSYTVTNISVSAVVSNGGRRVVGTAVIPAYSSNGSTSGYQNLRVDRNTNYTTVSWNAVSGAIRYRIKYTSPYNGITYDEFVSTTYYNFNFGSTASSWSVAVYAVPSSGNETYVGGATITPNGVNQSFNNNINGNTSTGSNCQVTRYATEAYLTWNPTNSSWTMGNAYRIVYAVEGEQSSKQLYSQTPAVTIPVGSSYTFTVNVYDNYSNQMIASGRFVGTSNTTTPGNIMDIKKSEVKNLKVTNVNSYTTKVSWDRTSDAAYYLIQYGTLDGSITDEDICYNNYYDKIPFGSSRGYFVNVYYWSNKNSRYYEVGHVYNVPGSDSTSSTTKNYPSEFKATSGTSKKITLSWTAADGASYYNVYYKRSTSSKWLKINKDITKTAVNVSGLTDGISYQFKVVTNKGVESGILTIAPSTTSSTVRANDPVSNTSNDDDGDVSIADDAPSLRAVTSNSKGSITVSWTNIGVSSYRIYVAEANSNTYKYCGTYTGTQATISTFGSGSNATSFTSGKSYKVRVVRSDYKNYGTISNALSSCSPLTVTVK